MPSLLNCAPLILFSFAMLPAAVTVTVDWRDTTYAIDAHAFGLNGFKATNPDLTADSRYIDNLKYLLGTRSGGGMLRIHTWEMLGQGENGWLDAEGAWDAARIRAALTDIVDEGITVCINIPDGSTEHNRVDNPEAFARFCAELVRIVNTDGGPGVEYWEVPNERDGERTGAQMALIFNAAAEAMKAVDSSIKVGGPAYHHPHRSDEVRSFVDRTLDNLDFLSFHNYAGGGGMSDQEVWNAAGAQWYNNYIRAYLDEKSPDRYIPLWYDEFNVGWSWELAREQQNGICGAIYDALTLSKALDYGADVLCAWNEKDGSYGKMDDNYALRPATHVFHLFNAFVYGWRVATTTDHDSLVVPYASVGDDGRHTLVLTNRTKADQTVTLSIGGWAIDGDLTAYRLTAGGYGEIGSVSPSDLAGGIVLPAESVTSLTSVPVTATRLGSRPRPVSTWPSRPIDGAEPLFDLAGRRVPVARLRHGTPGVWLRRTP